MPSTGAAFFAWSRNMRFALLAILLLAPWLSQGAVRRFALVVGSNVGDGVAAAPLRYADDDAFSMHELLTEAGMASVLLAEPDRDTQRLHPNTVVAGPPTLARLNDAIAAQRAQMRRAQAAGDSVEWFFFFSGHGEVDGGEGFLGLMQGRLTRRILHDALDQSPAARSHVIIDACKSALMVSDKGPGGRRVPFPSSFATSAAPAPNVGFIVSASSTRDSHEWERFQAGVFSYEVRSGLRGADTNGDGDVSYAELGAFLETANEGIASAQHRPDFVVLPPRGGSGLAEPLLRWPGAPAVAADQWLGHVYVERPNGERVLDLHPAPGFVARLFLPLERPLYLRTSDETQELSLVQGVESLAMLESTVPATRPKGALSVAMGQLFAVPFDASTVSKWSSSWEVPNWNSIEARSELSARQRARPAVGWVAIGTGALGAASLGVAWWRSTTATALSQQARGPRNDEIAVFNTVGVASLGVSAAALIAWQLLGWDSTGVTLGLEANTTGAAVTFGFQLP